MRIHVSSLNEQPPGSTHIQLQTCDCSASAFRVKKGNPILLEDPVLNAIAEKYRRTPAQIALRYQLQRGIVVLAKSFNRKRIQENFQVQSMGLKSRRLTENIILCLRSRYLQARVHDFMVYLRKVFFLLYSTYNSTVSV